jgi:hypothetical protein
MTGAVATTIIFSHASSPTTRRVRQGCPLAAGMIARQMQSVPSFAELKRERDGLVTS